MGERGLLPKVSMSERGGSLQAEVLTWRFRRLVFGQVECSATTNKLGAQRGGRWVGLGSGKRAGARWTAGGGIYCELNGGGRGGTRAHPGRRRLEAGGLWALGRRTGA